VKQATYSGVSVYEMEVSNVAVMRRRSDGWLNASQILKVAEVEKRKRTIILQREIGDDCEKIQGGYGKYQGTWINYAKGVQFCEQYGVWELLRPLLEYDMSPNNLREAAKGGTGTLTKEQVMASRQKRLLARPSNGGLLENGPENVGAGSPQRAILQKGGLDFNSPAYAYINQEDPGDPRNSSQQQQQWYQAN
jgi:regulatory protein SWI6